MRLAVAAFWLSTGNLQQMLHSPKNSQVSWRKHEVPDTIGTSQLAAAQLGHLAVSLKIVPQSRFKFSCRLWYLTPNMWVSSLPLSGLLDASCPSPSTPSSSGTWEPPLDGQSNSEEVWSNKTRVTSRFLQLRGHHPTWIQPYSLQVHRKTRDSMDSWIKPRSLRQGTARCQRHCLEPCRKHTLRYRNLEAKVDFMSFTLAFFDAPSVCQGTLAPAAFAFSSHSCLVIWSISPVKTMVMPDKPLSLENTKNTIYTPSPSISRKWMRLEEWYLPKAIGALKHQPPRNFSQLCGSGFDQWLTDTVQSAHVEQRSTQPFFQSAVQIRP